MKPMALLLCALLLCGCTYQSIYINTLDGVATRSSEITATATASPSPETTAPVIESAPGDGDAPVPWWFRPYLRELSGRYSLNVDKLSGAFNCCFIHQGGQMGQYTPGELADLLDGLTVLPMILTDKAPLADAAESPGAGWSLEMFINQIGPNGPDIRLDLPGDGRLLVQYDDRGGRAVSCSLGFRRRMRLT